MWARLFSLLFVITFAVSGWAQFNNHRSGDTFAQPESSVSVSVRSDQNQPISDARVELRDLSTGQLVSSGYTNSLGIAELSCGEGSYEVTATKGVDEARERFAGGFGNSVALRIRTSDGNGAGSSSSVSVAQYKVPGKARGEYKKAEECVSKRQLEDARRHLDKALELYPHFAEALTLRGIMKLDANDPDGSLNDFHEALQIDPSYSTAYLAAGASYNRIRKFDDALMSLDRGVALAPASWQGYFELAKAKIGKADYAGAVRMLDKAQSLLHDPYPFIHLVKAHALLALKDYNNAMTELQAFLQTSPDAPQAAQARNMLDQTKAFLAAQNK